MRTRVGDQSRHSRCVVKIDHRRILSKDVPTTEAPDEKIHVWITVRNRIINNRECTVYYIQRVVCGLAESVLKS